MQPRRWHENVSARFVKGTLKRIREVRRLDETQTQFIADAVVAEILRRERDKERNNVEDKHRRSDDCIL